MKLGSTIAICRSTRDTLKKMGRKGQTYDELINELIKIKRNRSRDSLDSRFKSLQSGESEPIGEAL